jgi:hypothetical protein
MKSSGVEVIVHVTFLCKSEVIHFISGKTWSVYFRASFTSSFNKNPFVSKQVPNQFSLRVLSTGISSFTCNKHSHPEKVIHHFFQKYSFCLFARVIICSAEISLFISVVIVSGF